MKVCFAVIAALLSSASVCHGTPQCKSNPKVVAACYTIHGRAQFGSGTPTLRNWPNGTKRMLGVTAGPHADDAEDPICPKEMLIDPNQVLFGDFEVCPFTPERKGEMQMVLTARSVSITTGVLLTM